MYNLFFQPLIDILKYIYLFIVKLTGNYGVSLILLSVAVNIILRPISNWAAKVQNKERRIQEILSPQIAEIKNNYHGAEQHFELNELYKAYGYNPIYAVRSGLDLFIQLPLLTAAYIMLSSLKVLDGQSFGLIKNLIKPDNLFAGINILPILMTLINFAATLTAKSFTKRERVQAFIIAILFLILLYDAPSALLIYWTMNNFIMLIKNFADLKIITLFSTKISAFFNYEYKPSLLWIFCVRFITFLLMFVAMGAYFYYLAKNVGLVSEERMLIYMYGYIALIAVVFAWTRFAAFLENKYSIAELIFKSLYFILGALFIFIFYSRYMILGKESVVTPNADSSRFILFAAFSLLYIAFAFMLPVSAKKIFAAINNLTDNRENSLFFASSISFLIFLFIFSPAVIYRSDPAFFTNTLLNLLSVTARYCVLGLFILTIIWLVLPEIMRKAFAIFTGFLVLIFLVNAFIFTDQTGPMDAIRFTPIKIAVWKDFYSVALSFLIIAVCVWRKRINYFIQALTLLSFAMLGAGFYCYLNVKDYGNDIDKADIKAENPDYHDALWSFSRDNKNVVGIFLDMFTGDHLERIIAENPSIAERLDGFIYFPDTLATGYATIYSTPSIYGGTNYKPQVLNKNFPNKSLNDKFAEAHAMLPKAFASAGYSVVMAGAPAINAERINKYFSDNIINDIKLLDEHWGEDYIKYWEQTAEANNIKYKFDDEITPIYISILSLLRGFPFSLRTAAYKQLTDNGGDSDIGMQFALKLNFLHDIFLSSMKDFVFADNGKPKLKIIYNALPHLPWYLSADSLQPVADPYPDTAGQLTLVNGIIPEHYYTERHAINFVCDFLDALKKIGVYDNTRIVIFSDHDEFDSWRLNSMLNRFNNIDVLEDNSYPGRPNALLLFKDFNSRGTMQTSDALMSCEDVPSLLSSGIVNIKDIPDINALKNISGPDRVRTHFVDASIVENMNSNIFRAREIYEVKGTMFKRENWRKIYSDNSAK